jgi:hypothetical protein
MKTELENAIRILGWYANDDDKFGQLAAASIEELKTLKRCADKNDWVNLSDDEIYESGKEYVEDKFILPHGFAREIERMLKEKNSRG